MKLVFALTNSCTGAHMFKTSVLFCNGFVAEGKKSTTCYSSTLIRECTFKSALQ